MALFDAWGDAVKLLKEVLGAAAFLAIVIAMGYYGNTCGQDGRQDCQAYTQGAK